MDCKCPNCKGDAKQKTIEGVEYIECRDIIGADACGWFRKQPDGTWTSCEKPSIAIGGAVAVDAASPDSNGLIPSSAKPDRGGTLPPRQPADVDEDDDGGLEVTLTDEIDY